VLLRSDSSPTYNFCCVIDDSLMKISPRHPRRRSPFEYASADPSLRSAGRAHPSVRHLSTILGPDGQKLSKRHGATSIEEFRRQGYLPEALANYLTLLGWSSPNDGQEIMSLEEITGLFDLTRVQKNPAIFDNAKLAWMNRNYINKTSGEALAERRRGFLSTPVLVPAQLDDATRVLARSGD